MINDLKHILADYGLRWWIHWTPTKDKETWIAFHKFMEIHVKKGLDCDHRKN